MKRLLSYKIKLKTTKKVLQGEAFTLMESQRIREREN